MGKNDTRIDDNHFLNGLRRSDTQAFTDLFDRYYVDLVMFCGNYIRDLQQCEDIVSGIFMRLWEKRESLSVEKSLKSYLLSAVRNRALNEIRRDRICREHIRDLRIEESAGVYDVDSYILYSDMRILIDKAVSGLPEKIKESYIMRIECGMKSAEIARKLNVTQRTVELRISRALSVIKKCVVGLLLLIIVI